MGGGLAHAGLVAGSAGAGKGTQADRIAAWFQLVHLATGELLRANVADGTPLGEVAQAYLDSGELVPDEVVVAMMLERLTQPDCKRGFLLDGFPRSVAQARALDEHPGRSGRAAGRGHQPGGGRGGAVASAGQAGRADDNARTIRNRLQVFAASTRPLLDYYEKRGLLFSVAAVGTVDEVSERILHAPRDVTRRTPAASGQPRTSRDEGVDVS